MGDYYERDIHLDTEEMADYLFHALLAYGFVPESEEVELIADIFFDYMVEKMFIEEFDPEKHDLFLSDVYIDDYDYDE